MVHWIEIRTDTLLRNGLASGEELKKYLDKGYRFSHMPWNEEGSNRWRAIEDIVLLPRRICSWCRSDMGPAPEGYVRDTHGICKVCSARELEAIRQIPREHTVVSAMLEEFANEIIR